MRPQDLNIGSLFEGVQDAVIVAEAATGRIVLWNPMASEVFGYSPAEALEMNVEELVPARLKARHQAEMSRYRQTGHDPYIDSGTVLELPAVQKGGEEIHIELTLSPIEPVRDVGAREQFMLAIVRDVTVRKRAEEETRRFSEGLKRQLTQRTTELEAASAELRSSEERYRLLVESLRDYAIFAVGADGFIANWNVGAERIFGYREEEIVGKDFPILFTPEDAWQGIPERELREAIAEGRAEDERWHMRKDGSRFWASGIVTPIRNKAGKLLGFTKVARDLTERKRAAEELLQSEERFRATFEQAAVSIGHTDMEGHFLRVNQKLCDIVGYSREELLEKSFQDITHPDDLEADLEQMSRLLAGEISTYSMEKRYIKKDGSILWTNLTVSLVREPSGEPGYFIAVVDDITERKRAEEELRESHTLLHSIIEGTADAIFTKDIGGRYLLVNTSCTEIVGKPIEEILGKTDAELYPPEVANSLVEVDRRVTDTGETITLEEVLPVAGSMRTYLSTKTPYRDHRGNVAGLIGVSTDITERKRTERALEESEERFRALVQNSSDIITVIDVDGTIRYVSPAVERVMGYRPEELVGSNVFDYVLPVDLGEAQTMFAELWSRPGVHAPFEFKVPHKDGSWRYSEFLVNNLLDDPSVRGVVVNQRDITERRRAEEELKESHKRIEDILESITDAFVAVDHEWRYTYANERALHRMRRIRGEELTREEVLGKSMWELFPDAVGTTIYEKFQEAMRERKTVEFEAYFPPRDEWIEAHAYPSEDGLAIYYRDITGRKRVEEELRGRARQQEAVARLGRQALVEADLQTLVDEAASLVARTLDVEYCKIMELLPEGEELLLRAGIGWDEGLVGRATEGTGLGSQAGFTLLSGQPVIVEDLREEDRFSASALLRDHGAVSGMSVIIEGRERPFGILSAHSKTRRVFTRDDINFLQAVANVLAAAIEHVEVEEALREIRETERNRLARDLHDEALQDLTRALVETQFVQKVSEYETLNRRLERVGEALKRTAQGIHAAIYDLRLEGAAREQTLVEMLESLVELNRQDSPDCEIELSVDDGFSPTLSKTMQVELLRILREALTNALRHSGADRVHIAVGATEGKLRAGVEDDGRGFDPAKRGVAGMGIQGMRERASALGGDLRIVSKPGEGTKVRFELVLKKDQGEPEEVRILLVDDHASVRQAMASVFEREPGFRVAGEAGSLSEARQMLDGVDVAVVDLGLPDGYGGELIQELRTHNPRAQALVLSAILNRSEIARAVESGAAGVLHKLIGMDEVVEAVRRLKAGETLLPLDEIVELLRFAGSRREEEYEASQAIARLTSREVEILQALAEGFDSREIAERLHISVKTEANHMTSILSKLGLHSRLHALVFAVRHGLVEIH